MVAFVRDAGRLGHRTWPLLCCPQAKTDAPPAEDAAGAVRGTLEARKLSNKINYSALAEVLNADGLTGVPGAADAAASAAAAQSRHASQQPSRSRLASPEPGPGPLPGTAAAATTELPGAAGEGGEGRTAVSAALAEHAAQRARAAAAEQDRYAVQLEQERQRMGASGGGLLDYGKSGAGEGVRLGGMRGTRPGASGARRR